MKTFPHIVRRRGAYTLLELMVAVTTASAIFAVILTSGVAIYRSCSAAEDYSHQSNEQLRAVDYLTRDLHSALSVTIPLSGGSLALTMPDSYTSYDSAGIPTSGPVDPVIVDGVPVYGDATQPITVSYSVSNGSLIREQFVPSSGLTTQLVVASEVGTFDPTFVPLSGVVKFSLTFAPLPHPGITALRPGTTVSATVEPRMLQKKIEDSP